ncbi:unnamed protein product [Closterium sp. Yama58-4]|nr:unnamed protein product [Closterium sp. Yama58-4]
MNVNDLEVVLGILKSAGFNVARADRPEEARVILVNTCAIRENAEAKVAVLGCMAERLKEQLVAADKMVDVVCGPDAYRDLPRLLDEVEAGQPGVNTLLSLDETYADVSPVRLASNSVSAFVTIMRGCDNMCSYCIVPFTRGRERSRPIRSILGEIEELAGQGVKEIYLLGQNVNSYRDTSESDTVDSVTATVSSSSPASSSSSQPHLTPGFSTIYKPKLGGIRFATLLDEASRNFPDIRFRFTSPHPKDFPEELLSLMAARGNVCKSLHLPAQSGSSSVLGRMRRGYSREAYLQLVDRVRSVVPGAAISSDFITGFCGETEEDHQQTLSLMRAVGYDMAYMFAYSLRPRTHAHRRLEDDVPEEVKQRRLSELVATFRETTAARYSAQVGTRQVVLVEGPNKRSPHTELIGKTDLGHRVTFHSSLHQQSTAADRKHRGSSLGLASEGDEGGAGRGSAGGGVASAGDYVLVDICGSTHASLRGVLLGKCDLSGRLI